METSPIQTELQKTLDQLRRLRDEVRVQAHLGGMEAKKAWDELEPKLAEADRLAEKASEESLHAAVDALRKLKDLKLTLKK
ncbi:MAG TPA: hypothetical protein VLM85_22725 [Polyangiaceae bacterium]|nr:hypothetical protein [Polyangiaceae bacterium]